MADGSLVFDTKLDSSGVSTGLSSIETGLGKIASVAKVAFLAIGTAMGTATVAGIHYNAQMEQYQTSFEVMLGSAQKASDLMAQLKELGANTPFETKDLADTAQLLLNYGITAGNLIPTLKMLGDISQGNADKMQRVSTAYGQMSSAGKVQLQDVKQMIEAGFNPLKEISDSTGESMGSLYDRISRGTISVDEITQSMVRSTSAGGKYFQSMEKQSETLNGRWSTLKDTVMQFIGSAITPLTDFIRDKALPTLIDFISKLNIDEIIKNFVAFYNKFKPLIVAVTALTAAVIAYKIALVAISVTQSAYVIALYAWDVIVGILTGKITLMTIAQAALNLVMSLNPVALIIVAIVALIAIFAVLWNKCESFRLFWQATWIIISSAIKAAWEFISGIFNAVVNFIKNNWQALLLMLVNPFAGAFKLIYDNCTWFRNMINNLISAVQNTFTGLVNYLWALPGRIWGAIVSAISNVANWASQIYNTATYWINYMIATVVLWLIALPGKIWSAIVGAISNIYNWAVQIHNTAVNWISSMVNSVINWVSSLPRRIWSSIVGAISNISNWASSIYNTAVNGIGNMVNSVVNRCSSLPGRIWGAIVGAIGSISNWVGSMYNTAVNGIGNMSNGIIDSVSRLPGRFVSIGSSIVDGLWSGLSNGWRWLTDKVSNLGKSLLDGVKGVLGIHSPSKEFAKIGGFCAEGLYDGFEKEDPVNQIKGALQASLGTIQANLLGSTGSSSNNYNNQTINFNQSMQSPDEISRTLRLQNRYGLAGATV